MKYIRRGKCFISLARRLFCAWCIIMVILALGAFAIWCPTLAGALATACVIYPVLEETSKKSTDRRLPHSPHGSRQDSQPSSSRGGPQPVSESLKIRLKVHLDAELGTEQSRPKAKFSHKNVRPSQTLGAPSKKADSRTDGSPP